MSYYTRILTPSTAKISVTEMRRALKAAKSPAGLEVEAGSDESWQQLAGIGKDHAGIFTVARTEISEDSVGSNEIQEFLAEIPAYRPASAVHWLQEYLPTVRTIYAFQHLAGMSKPNGRKAFDIIQSLLWSKCGGIFQADDEGFSNEQGYHILWQFSDRVNGSWSMALADGSGGWHQFEMDLGNLHHRDSFQQGRVPTGCVLIGGT
jgi:hypothetical protein